MHQVLDQEEEIALEEFAKFEEKLKAQRRQEPEPTPKGASNAVTG